MSNTLSFDTYTDIQDLEFFSLSKTVDCGQCFRFFEKDGYIYGIAQNKCIKAVQTDDKTLRLFTATNDLPFWRNYFALDTDYASIRASLPSDETSLLSKEISSGIRILNQDKWEALCSFIISQNNNIPRIKKLIEALSKEFGEKIETSDGIFYSFPEAEKIASADIEALRALKLGFRAEYVLDAAKKVVNEPDFLERVSLLDTKEATKLLCEIKGVGPKVASCALLFGFGKKDAFPIDVWVKRILDKYYPSLSYDKAGEYFGEYAGIAQQYLFYYERYVVSEKKG